MSYSIVEGGFTGAGAGSLASDPQFVDVATGDFRLTAASPAIDAADRSALAADAPYDRGLAPRSADAPAVPDTGNGAAPVVDMGAFEFSIGIGDLYCSALPNSTGVTSTLTATGSIALADNDLNLTVFDLPLNRFGYFLLSDVHASVAVSNGTLCLGAPIVRFIKNVLNTGGAGSVSFTPDLTNLPQGLTFQVGETWTFQLWHRDVTGSNFSSSLGFTWE